MNLSPEYGLKNSMLGASFPENSTTISLSDSRPVAKSIVSGGKPSDDTEIDWLISLWVPLESVSSYRTSIDTPIPDFVISYSCPNGESTTTSTATCCPWNVASTK